MLPTLTRATRAAMTQQSAAKLPIHRLPIPSARLQKALTRLELDENPSSQRRSKTFPPATPGIWARVTPMWTEWPIRMTKEEALDMGVDVDKGQQLDVEAVLRRWDPVDVDDDAGSGNIKVLTSQHRLKLNATVLGISESALRDSLPNLDVGDAMELDVSTESTESSARVALVDILSGRKVLGTLPGDNDEYGPWSTRYCGHQFGVWAGQLGDGRAISLLETISDAAGRQEIQTKGTGRTPFSRQADGLAVLRSSVREYLASEGENFVRNERLLAAMAALGIPTTRALAILYSPVVVYRENGPEPASAVARVAPSFIRLGHFEALNPGEAGRSTQMIFLGGSWADQKADVDPNDPLRGQGNLEGLRDLTAWVKNEVMQFPGSAKDWFLEVVRRNAETVAAWQLYGFMHGVLNTDNISILGLTIDYGPYAFMDQWNENHICNHSDPTGLYSYRNQPNRVLFALDSLASALLPIIGYEAETTKFPEAGWSADAGPDDVRKWEQAGLDAIKGWNDQYNKIIEESQRAGWQKRFGLQTYRDSDDRDIVQDYLMTLRAHSGDFHASLRLLSAFEPARVDDDDYRRAYAQRWVATTTVGLPSDSISRAEEAITAWLRVYAARAKVEEEAQAWGAVEGEGSWESKRTAGMRRANPRFVLRQWVLEEVIKETDDAVQGGDIPDARKTLARVLDMAVHPFEPYGEADDGNINPCDGDEEAAARMRLCGLGPRGMLGFQCSCSS